MMGSPSTWLHAIEIKYISEAGTVSAEAFYPQSPATCWQVSGPEEGITEERSPVPKEMEQ